MSCRQLIQTIVLDFPMQVSEIVLHRRNFCAFWIAIIPKWMFIRLFWQQHSLHTTYNHIQVLKNTGLNPVSSMNRFCIPVTVVSVDEIVTFLRISHYFIRLICRNSCPVPNLIESKACCTKL